MKSLGTDTVLTRDECGRLLVLKKLNSACLLQGRLHPGVRERLERVRELPLPSVANFCGVQQDRDGAFLVWSYVEGRTLEEHLAGVTSETERSRLFRDVRIVVESLHRFGIIHGAIHGRNLIVDDLNKLHLTHISPLLFSDPEVDEKALSMLTGPSGSGATPTRSVLDDADGKARRRMLASVAAITFISIAVAVALIWRLR